MMIVIHTITESIFPIVASSLKKRTDKINTKTVANCSIASEDATLVHGIPQAFKIIILIIKPKTKQRLRMERSVNNNTYK